MGPDRTRKQDLLCWLGPAAIWPTDYVSATKPNRLMPFMETIAVYCDNHMKHKYTLRGQNAEF
jgi:hypothetical protein